MGVYTYNKLIYHEKQIMHIGRKSDFGPCHLGNQGESEVGYMDGAEWT
jgi:hypothetical protein